MRNKILLLLVLTFAFNYSYAAINWMGNHSTSAQPSNSQTIHFYVEMYPNYYGCHAEVTINEGGTWTSYTMTYAGANGNNSTWSVDVNVLSNATEYYFHGWDDNGVNVWDSNGGSNYSITINPTTASDGNWSNSSTWYDGSVPTNTTATYVIANNVILDDNVSVGNLSINSGASLTVNVGDGLTVSGNLTNNAAATDLTVSSDATGNGSLIVNGTVTGSATVQRYIAAYSATANGWHEIGSPVNNLAVAGSGFEPGTSDDLYAWDESNNIWSNYKQSNGTHPFSTFTNGQGYLVASNSTGAKSFTGTLNNGNIIFNNMSYNTTQGNGWHLLGNPYPSALTWGDANWSLTNVGGVAKVWNESGANYSDVSSGGVIPSTNGFFVQVTSGTNSLTIPAADRVHDATNNYKSVSATTPKETLKFKITNNANGYYDVSTLGFKANATKGFDNAFDSHKLFSMVKTAPSLWTVSKDQDFSTNYLPLVTTAYNVPLDFKAGVSTVYHLTIQGADSFENTRLVLEDLQTGQKIDLSQQNSYDFSATTGENDSRFVLHINGVTGVPSESEITGVQVFSHGNTVYLHGQQSLNGKVSIFNTLGQKVYEGVLNGAVRQQIRLNQRQGIYFVRLEESNHVVTRKVFIK